MESTSDLKVVKFITLSGERLKMGKHSKIDTLESIRTKYKFEEAIKFT